MNIQDLKDKLKYSYSPYSNFKVAALAIDENNHKYYGVNCENIAFPSGLCAERAALFASVVNGAKVGSFKEIHIISSGKDTILPCSGCRQVMLEFMQPDSMVYCYNGDGNLNLEITLDKLNPYGVWPNTLKLNEK
ncbi:cytidine deaminase [Mycoplasma miroungirhinis]|uniref:Cytidine deaminase n=1 Tax=Mycoplasma miroungirhinis TaxID=754516 RepID=A0A6M4JC09_9MOLU|nr:cytidine deaminase [Mycoplasma miroungirhinis]QJR44450.1 cytidine deaminase [Mycoplasma miroungirhinis]